MNKVIKDLIYNYIKEHEGILKSELCEVVGVKIDILDLFIIEDNRLVLFEYSLYTTEYYDINESQIKHINDCHHSYNRLDGESKFKSIKKIRKNNVGRCKL